MPCRPQSRPRPLYGEESQSGRGKGDRGTERERNRIYRIQRAIFRTYIL